MDYCDRRRVNRESASGIRGQWGGAPRKICFCELSMAATNLQVFTPPKTDISRRLQLGVFTPKLPFALKLKLGLE